MQICEYFIVYISCTSVIVRNYMSKRFDKCDFFLKEILVPIAYQSNGVWEMKVKQGKLK